jgi:hypothetical protein
VTTSSAHFCCMTHSDFGSQWVKTLHLAPEHVESARKNSRGVSQRMLSFFFFSFFFSSSSFFTLQHWGWNSGPCPCQAGALPLEPPHPSMCSSIKGWRTYKRSYWDLALWMTDSDISWWVRDSQHRAESGPNPMNVPCQRLEEAAHTLSHPLSSKHGLSSSERINGFRAPLQRLGKARGPESLRWANH